MKRLPVLLLLCALLLQWLGSAWAAAGMAGAGLQRSDAAAEALPPCHRPPPPDAGDGCFDEGGCRCLAACLSQPPLCPQAAVPGFVPVAAARWIDGRPAAPRAGYRGPPLRPPSSLRV